MEQYPHSIVITVKEDPTLDEDTGIYTEGDTTEYTLDCRAEVNGKGDRITGRDGILIDFQYNCYLPKMTTVIPLGSAYVLNETENGTVKRASNGQLNSRLWL